MRSALNDIYEDLADDDFRRAFVQERTIVELTEEICRLMDEQGVSRSDLAKRIGKSKSQVTQMLGGDRNLTLRSLSDMLFVLGRAIEPQTRAVDEAPRRYVSLTETGGATGWKNTGTFTAPGQAIPFSVSPISVSGNRCVHGAA